jgi:hypothetical protein
MVSITHVLDRFFVIFFVKEDCRTVKRAERVSFSPHVAAIMGHKHDNLSLNFLGAKAPDVSRLNLTTHVCVPTRQTSACSTTMVQATLISREARGLQKVRWAEYSFFIPFVVYCTCCRRFLVFGDPNDENRTQVNGLERFGAQAFQQKRVFTPSVVLTLMRDDQNVGHVTLYVSQLVPAAVLICLSFVAAVFVILTHSPRPTGLLQVQAMFPS